MYQTTRVLSEYPTEKRPAHIQCTDSIAMKLPIAVSGTKRLRRPTDRWLTWRLCTVAKSTDARSPWCPPDGPTSELLFCTTAKPTHCGIRIRVYISKDGCPSSLQTIRAGVNGRRSIRSLWLWTKQNSMAQILALSFTT